MNKNNLLKLIRNLKETTNLDNNQLLRMCIFEFFLEKLEKSEYCENFVIKGGFLVSALSNIRLRTTMDLDITFKHFKLEREHVQKTLEAILSIETISDLDMKIISLEEIRESSDYQGLRANIKVIFDGIEDMLKIDFTTGDILTEEDQVFNYQSLIYNKEFTLKSYNIETLLAEKIETILSRGVLNTRSRDYYDVYILWNMYKTSIDIKLLKKAIERTSEYRKTKDEIYNEIDSIYELIKNSSELIKLWNVYQTKFSYAKDIKWEQLMEVINDLISLAIKKQD